MPLAVVAQRYHEELGAFENALDLEPQEFLGARSQRLRGEGALVVDQGVDAAAELLIGDPDEAPRLHQTDAGSGVRGLQQARQHILGHHTTGHEPAHVSPFGDHAIHRPALLRREHVVGHTAIVESRGCR
jgi:hypothetical protein